MKKAWEDIVRDPMEGRLSKPRALGWTMVIDKGLTSTETRHLLRLAGEYLDLLKLAFGTSTLYDTDLLQEKTACLHEAGVGVMPGGTLGEVAVLQERWPAYLRRAVELGCDFIEISDGTIDMKKKERRMMIETAIEAGLHVVAEVGKKDPGMETSSVSMVEQALDDLRIGAEMVIIEGRESGKGVGIYQSDGAIEQERLLFLARHLPLERVIWEAPQKKQQEELILAFGPNVNLGNIPPAEILSLEALRRGLRGDTLRVVLTGRESESALLMSGA